MFAQLWRKLLNPSRRARLSRRFVPEVALLEDRLAPATFAETATLLSLDFNVASKSLAIVSNGTSYSLTLTGDTWTGTDSANVTGNGLATLTVTAAGLAAFDHVNITDSTAGSAVTFNNSGASAYADHFNVTLDDAAAGAITFSGATSFTGSASLSASTTRNIVVNAGASIATVDGSLTLNANQQGTPTAGTFVGVDVSGLIQATGTGAVTVKGKGGNSGANQHGLRVQAGGDILGGTTDLLTVIGRGGASSGNTNYGVLVTGAGSTITSNGSSVEVTGTGGGTGISIINAGVLVESGGQISAGGAGSVTAVGNGGNTTGSGSFNHGLQVDGANSLITSSGGNIAVTGAGGGATTSTVNIGMLINNGGQVTAGGAGSVTAIGNGGNLTGSGGFNHGIQVEGANSRITSSGGNVVATGTGGGATTSTVNIGLLVNNAGQISAGGMGVVTAVGNGGNTAGTGANNLGLQVNGANSLITSGGGNVAATGTGGGAGTSGINIGLLVNGAAQITAGGAGTVTAVGNGGNTAGTAGNFNHGLQVEGANSRITSAGGNVSATGTGGGAGASVFNFGVLVNLAAQITAGGSATVTVVGDGGNLTGTGTANYGVIVADANSIVTSNAGDVSVTGTGGGAGTGNTNIGVLVQSGGVVTAGPAANVTVLGTGGAGTGGFHFGVLSENANSRFTTVNGALHITGNGGAGGANNHGVRVQATGAITTTGSGDVTITGTAGVGSPSFGFSLSNAFATGAKLESTGTGDFTIVADSFEITATESITAGANVVSLQQQTDDTLINVGGADAPGTLGLDETELDRIIAATLRIGNDLSGTLTINSDVTRAAATDLTLTSGSDIVFAAGQIDTGGGTLKLDSGPHSPAAAIKPIKAGVDVAASTLTFGSILNIDIAGATSDTQYSQLNVAGIVDLTGLDLFLSGAYVPIPGESFVIVENDGADLVTGTFNGLPDGAIVYLNGVPLRITYGNDVVLDIPIGDNFNRADSATLGPNWTIQSGTVGIQTNMAVNAPNAVSIATWNNPALTDAVVRAEFVNVTAPAARAGLVARYKGTGEFTSDFYLGMVWQNPVNGKYEAHLFLKRAGVPYVQIGPSADLTGIFNGTGSLRFQVVSNQLKLFVDEELTLVGYDATLAGAGQIGMRGQASSVDNFSAASVPPLPAALPFSDSFTRTSNSNLDRLWIERAGAFTIQGQTAEATDIVPEASLAGLNMPPAADMIVRATVDIAASGSYAGLVARASGANAMNSAYYLGVVDHVGAAYTAYLFRKLAGSEHALLASKDVTALFAAPGAKTLRFETLGNQLKLYVNNAVQVVAYDAMIAAPGAVGMRGFNATYDEFNAITAPPINATLSFIDDFDTPDNRPDLDRTWTERVGAFSTQNNNAAVVAGISLATVNSISTGDVSVGASVDITAAGAYAGLVARYAGPGDGSYYLAVLFNNGGVYQAFIFLKQPVGFTQLAMQNLAGFSGTGLLRFDLLGQSLKLFVDNVEKAAANDNTLATGMIGMRGFNAVFDDFVAS